MFRRITVTITTQQLQQTSRRFLFVPLHSGQRPEGVRPPFLAVFVMEFEEVETGAITIGTFAAKPPFEPISSPAVLSI